MQVDKPEICRRFGPILDDGHELLLLLRVIFNGKGSLSVQEFSDELGMSADSIYKMFGGDRPLRADVLLHALVFSMRKSRNDTRLIDYIADLADMEARPKTPPRVRRVMRDIESNVRQLVLMIPGDKK